MSSIALSLSTRTNLLALQTTTKFLDRTSQRLSTGLKVNGPLDDAAAFFSAQALNFQADKFISSNTTINQASSALSTAISGIESITKLVQNAQGLLASLQTSTTLTQSATLVTQYNTLLAQIDVLAKDAAYQGINLINNSTQSLGVSFSGVPGANDISIAAQRSDSAGLFLSTVATNLFFVRQVVLPSQDSRASIASINSLPSLASRAAVSGVGTLASTDSQASQATQASVGSTPSQPSNNTNGSVPSQSSRPSVPSYQSVPSRDSQAAINAADSVASTASTASIPSIGSQSSIGSLGGVTIAAVNTTLVSGTALNLSNALSGLQGKAATLGSTNAILAVRLEFSKSYVATLQTGAAQLTVADLNEEGANLTSLQTAQQLGVVSLSISTQAQQSLLRLF